MFSSFYFFQNGVISKLVEHKGALRSSIWRICDLVERRDFIYTMTKLGMIDDDPTCSTSNSTTTTTKSDGSNSTAFSSTPTVDPYDGSRPSVDYRTIKLNLVKHLCESPNILYSHLSKNALRLLHSGEMSDMEFEVISSVSFAQSARNAFLANQLPKVHIFRAHRAIISARCEYFRRALLSGMKEDIDRKIVVQDTCPVIFRRFLLYLYGAPIDKTVSVDQICELMLLGDRYSLDELKDLCEGILKAQIDEESVICMLSLSDRFNLNTLKSNCLAFISNRMHLIKQELFVELGAKLKEEVYELIHWRSRTPQPWSNNNNNNTTLSHSAASAALFNGGETKAPLGTPTENGTERHGDDGRTANNSHTRRFHVQSGAPVVVGGGGGDAAATAARVAAPGTPPNSSRSPNRTTTTTAPFM